jgi:hypothetical protein
MSTNPFTREKDFDNWLKWQLMQPRPQWDDDWVPHSQYSLQTYWLKPEMFHPGLFHPPPPPPPRSFDEVAMPVAAIVRRHQDGDAHQDVSDEEPDAPVPIRFVRPRGNVQRSWNDRISRAGQKRPRRVLEHEPPLFTSPVGQRRPETNADEEVVKTLTA